MLSEPLNSHRATILCFVAYYLPGYRSGGPVRTLTNLVDQLGNEFDIRIVTRDRDSLDTEPYSNIIVDAWNTVGKAQVFYASNSTFNLRGVVRLLRETPHDVLYLNSFFSVSCTFLPLLAKRLGLVRKTPCVIAPRGEFSPGALALRAYKKRTYIFFMKVLGIFHGLHWQASSAHEEIDILRKMRSIARRVYVVPNLTQFNDHKFRACYARAPGPLRLIFLSRISPKKNLDFCLRVVSNISEDIELTIYGPKEQKEYWKYCKCLIDKLPESIKVTDGGQVPPEKVINVFSKHDVFVFPTRGENFGHVIFEALTAGTSVLVSDQTPWVSDKNGALQSLELDEVLWVDAINSWTRLDDRALAQRRNAAAEYLHRYSAASQSVDLTRKLFRAALGED